jgi:hypothetical protein
VSDELQSALVVPVPEAEPLVGELRAALDPSAAAGVPAHITLLYPFAPPDAIDRVMLDGLRAMFAASTAFRFSLTETAWFGDEVLYLRPEPAAPFGWMTERLAARFPEYLPYAGEFDELIPHLTVAMHGTRDAEDRLRAGLPVASIAAQVLLLREGAEGRWSVRDRFPLNVRASGASRVS